MHQHRWCFICSLSFFNLLHEGRSKLFPNFTMASLLPCFHLGQTHSVNCQRGLVPAPICPQTPAAADIPSSLSSTLVFLPSAVFFIVIGPQVHNSSFALLPLAPTSASAFAPVPATSLSSPLRPVSVNSYDHHMLFRSHQQFSQTLFLQSRPSRFLVFLTTSPFFWIRGKSSPANLQNSWVYSLLPLTHPQSQLPQPTSKIQSVP